MLLAIDAGNTNTVFAIFDGDRLVGSWRASTDVHRTADEYAVWLTQLMALDGLSREQVKAAVIATVVPQALYELRTFCRRYFKADPLVVGEGGVVPGLTVNIDRPSEVGADRLVNAVAAHSRYGAPVIVVDFGTATTFDLVGAGGTYEGGVIAPGVNLSLEALNMAAAKLPRIAVARPPRVLGKSTVGAMQSGVFWGYVGLIEGVLARIMEEVGDHMKTVATGGLAPLFADATDSIGVVDPDLTLYGLVEIDRRSRAPA